MWSLQLKIKIEIKSSMRVFPGGAVDGSLPPNAGDTSSIPSPRGFRMPQTKLVHCNFWACALATTEPVCLNPEAWVS